MKIVIVDDTNFSLQVVVKMVRHKYKDDDVLTFLDPREAMEEIRENGADLLISDIEMPNIMGTELARTVREHNPDIKIILMSGDIPAEKIDAPHDAFLAKPFGIKELCEAVEKLIAEQD